MQAKDIRTAMLIGKRGVELLQTSHVLLVGLGGVGSFVAEALARAGVGGLTLVDRDVVQESNLNRQLVALRSTLGKAKVDVMKERIHDINPDCAVRAFAQSWRAEHLAVGPLDYAVDAIDSVPAKIDIILGAQNRGIRVISSMGTGNKLDNTRFSIDDISQTHTCPLARSVRRKLRQHGIEQGVKVLYSTAPTAARHTEDEGGIGSIATVPSLAGLMIAHEVLMDLLSAEERKEDVM